MTKPVRPFLGETAETRVQNRRNLLIQRGFELLADNGWHQSSIAQICRDLKLNKRYFYESFKTLEELESAVVNKLTSELIAIALASSSNPAAKELDTEKLAQHVLMACLSWFVEDKRRAKVLFSNACENENTKTQRELVINQLAQTLASFGMEYHQPKDELIEITSKHQTIAKLSSALMIGGTIESTMNWLDGKLDLTLEEFAEYTAKLWVSLGTTTVEIALSSQAG